MCVGQSQAHLQHNIDECEWRGPHERDELRSGRRDERSGRLNDGIHARRFSFETERRIRGRECVRLGSNGIFNLFDRRLYDVRKGFQLGQGILGHIRR
jgi:hypothetical protein